MTDRSMPSPIAAEISRLIAHDRVHRRLYTDREILEHELRTVFRRTWLYVGHTSEVRTPGDYKRTTLGAEPVILVHAADGSIKVLVNRCRHRGALVCREASGNSKFFRCPYHAWTYRNDGALLGVPKRNRYAEDFDLDELGLASVPRVETYRGLVFGSFDEEIEPLNEYLGVARTFIDATLDFSLSGEIDCSLGATRHQYPGNWKLQMENGVDGYHTSFVHETYITIMSRAASVDLKFGSHAEEDGWVQSFPKGHALLARRADPRAIEHLEAQHPEYTAELEAKHGHDRLLEILAHMNLFIFPNLFLIGHHIRVVQPVDVRLTEVTMYPYLLVGAPDALNVQRLKEHEAFYPPTGFGTPDDYEVFASVQDGLAAESVPWIVLSRGLGMEEQLDDGCQRGAPTDELVQRGMYAAYSRLATEVTAR